MLGTLFSAGSSLLGGILGNRSDEKIAAKNTAMQKQFAQEGIRWKVADAKAAGIHPLAALGAQTVSYSPQVGGSNSLAQGLAAAGQDIGRAIDAKRTAGERIDAYTKTVQDLSLRRMGLENELLASQIAKTRQGGGVPPMPSAADRHLMEGQGNSPLVKVSPMGRTATDPTNPSSEPGSVPDIGYARTTTGWSPVPSKDVKERIEDNMPQEAMWFLRNQMAPTFGFNNNPPRIDPGPDHFWRYNSLTQEYQLVRRSKSRWMTGGFKGSYR